MNKTPRLMSRCALLGLWCIGAAAGAANLRPLSDEALSDVRGRDGLSFAVSLNEHIGSYTIGTSDSAGNPAALRFNNLATTGVIACALDIMPGASGSPDYVNLAFVPIGGFNILQTVSDMVVAANAISFSTSVMFQNMAFNGSSMQLTTSASAGVTFGMGVNLSIGNVLLQPNGQGNASGQMAISSVTLGAAGSAAGSPWVLADVTTQPGTFNIATDMSGNQYPQLTIGWPTSPGTAAASGSLQIGNITFNTPTGSVNLGSSSIGSMQVQYLNIKFRSS